MTGPPLVAVAHGSRDPRAQACVEAVLRIVRTRRPDLDVRAAYVQNAEPALPEVLATAGPGGVVVPLLLSRGYHVAVDIARAADAADAAVAAPLGPDELLTDVLAERLAEAGAPPDAPVVLGAAGSSDPASGDDVRAQAALLAAQRGAPVVAAYATAAAPGVDEAVDGLLTATGRPVAVASYLLAPGHFADVVAGAASTWTAAPIGAHTAVAELVLERYRSAEATRRRR